MWCLSPFLSKVISIKSALAGSPVPFFLRIKLWASVLGKICPCWQICCSPPKKTKNQGEGHVSPTQQNSQSPYQTQSNLTRH